MNVEDAEEYTQALGQIVAGGWRQIALGERLGVPKALELTTRDWVEGRLGGYVKLSIKERHGAVSELKGEGYEQRQIARILGVSEATVSGDASKLKEPEPEPLDAMGALAIGEIRDIEARKLAARGAPPKSPGAPNPLEPGRYRCLVIDPPWPIRKIERDARPNQGDHLTYPTMALDEIAALPISELVEPSGAHVYLWTTHRFLPAALELLEGWECRYECALTWRKNVGPTPFSWMYDTEHALFAHAGRGLELERKGLRLSVDASATGHSRKPDAFYDRVREASPGPRLDMFAREQREGFEPWGDEVAA